MAKKIDVLRDKEPGVEGAAPSYKGSPTVDVDDATSDAPNTEAEDFADMAMDLLRDEGDEDYPDLEVNDLGDGPEVIVEPESEPVITPEPAPVVETAPVPESEPVATVTPTPAPVPDPTPTKTYDEMRAESRQHIYDQIQFTDEQVEQLNTEPEVALRGILADAYIDVHQAVMTAVYTQLPGMLRNVQTEESKSHEAEQKFYQTWKDLKQTDPAHKQTIERISKVYRQVNPSASLEDAIRDIGAQAMIALKLPFNTGATPTTEPEPIAPHKPLKPAGAIPARAKGDSNVFETLANEMVDDDLM